MTLSVDKFLRKAKSHAKKGEIDLAVQILKDILDRYPKNKQAIERLKSLQQLTEAYVAPGAGPSRQQLVELTALYKEGKLKDCLAQGEVLAKRFPNEPITANLLGAVYVALGRPKQAVASYTRAIQIKFDFAEAHNNLGDVRKILGEFEEAVASYQRALQIKPDFDVAHNNLGEVLIDMGQPDRALSSFAKALQIQPNFADSHINLGTTLNSLGKPDEAIASYNRALQINPAFAKAHRFLSTVKTFQDGDPQIDLMLQLLERKSLPKEDRIHLNFGLAKAHEDINDYDKAFSYFIEGNRLCKEELNYKTASTRALFAKIKAAFSSGTPVLRNLEGLASDNRQQPIFILGMPRSGATLVEQILASHSQVYGAGELVLLGPSVSATEWISAQLSSDQIQSIRRSYFSGLERLRVPELYITDKMPVNFWWIGFIIAALPGASIIHVKRDARATCWSNFKHYFSRKGNGYAYDFQDVSEYYKMYIDLMAFWQKLFPGQIYDLEYEALTEHQEDESRKLFKHVGLNWEDQCLEFYKTERAIQTASVMQVRREMYQGSSNQWKKYEEYLGPMVKSLRGF